MTKEALQSEDTRLIMSLMGFNAFNALVVATTMSGIGGLADPKKMVSLMGLCPGAYRSEDTARHGRMRKAANRSVTWVMAYAGFMAARNDLQPATRARPGPAAALP